MRSSSSIDGLFVTRAPLRRRCPAHPLSISRVRAANSRDARQRQARRPSAIDRDPTGRFLRAPLQRRTATRARTRPPQAMVALSGGTALVGGGERYGGSSSSVSVGGLCVAHASPTEVSRPPPSAPLLFRPTCSVRLFVSAVRGNSMLWKFKCQKIRSYLNSFSFFTCSCLSIDVHVYI